jgi:hypothetical protein
MQCEVLRILPFPAHVKTASTDEEKLWAINNINVKVPLLMSEMYVGGAEV